MSLTHEEQRARELAKEATPGPWITEGAKDSWFIRPGHPMNPAIAQVSVVAIAFDWVQGKREEHEANARLIALANPQFILSVLSRLEEALEENKRLRTGLELTRHSVELIMAREGCSLEIDRDAKNSALETIDEFLSSRPENS